MVFTFPVIGSIPDCARKTYSGERAKGELPIAEKCAEKTERQTGSPYHAHVQVEYLEDGFESSIFVKRGFPEDIADCREGIAYQGSIFSDALEGAKKCADHLTRITGKVHVAQRVTNNLVLRDDYQVVKAEK